MAGFHPGGLEFDQASFVGEDLCLCFDDSTAEICCGYVTHISAARYALALLCGLQRNQQQCNLESVLAETLHCLLYWCWWEGSNCVYLSHDVIQDFNSQV